MNCLFYLFLLLPCFCLAQNDSPFEFDKEFYTCEDQWVVFPKKATEPDYIYGFIYLDQEAGFTFHLEGTFEVNDAGQLMAVPKNEEEKKDNSIKIRLQANTTSVYVLSDQQLQELKLPQEPKWLHFYKENQEGVRSLVVKGYHYNHVGGSQVGVNYLEEAYELEPDFDGLIFELAYAYNANKQYEKAVEVLEIGLKKEPKNSLFYRELGFAQVRLDQIKQGEKTYEKGIKLSDDQYQKSEMAVNMAQAYFKTSNKKGFKKWAKLTRKYAAKDAPFLKALDYWEKELK